MPTEPSINELIKEVYDLFSSFKEKLENPNYLQIESTLEQLIKSQEDMRESISELKKTLLNPYDGVVIENKRNTDYRIELEKWFKEYDKLEDEHRELMRWKTMVTRTAIAIFTASGGVISFLLSKYFEM
jgi:hypothetical protein